ncbi:MAG: arginine--tRNA ligase [Candidatus Dojkabacteria bacterium]|jgi:arginyl-tRNA synthetase|nr:arginine--tRNA ligase [Candidatus Dojkabacteria bacterium]
MIEVKEKIAENLHSIVKEMGVDIQDIVVQEPTDIAHGDLTSNIAMQLSKALKSNPMDIASKIVEAFPKDEDIERVEVVKPGFINFFLSNGYLLNMLKSINTQKEQYFELDIKKGKRYVIEYTDPNPFKTLHIGHLYTNIVGESFARLVEALGACVTRANYQGDVGLHVAKTMWGLLKMFEDEGITFEDLKSKTLVERVRYLGDAYMLGFKMYDDQKDESVIKDVKDINYYIFSLYIPSLEKKEYFKDLESKKLKDIYFEGRDWCLEYFERIYERTDTKFDKYYLESEMGEKGMEIVDGNMNGKGKNIFKASDGAVIYEGDESKGLHTRVFINSEGLPTYEAKELALAFKKFEQLSFDESVVITADEQSSYFKVVLDALSHLRPEVASIYKHFSHGLVRLPGAEKMSSRKGKILEGEWLLDETKKRVEEMMRSNQKWSEEQILEVSDLIAVASIKYSFLKVTVGKDVIFDFDKATSFDGDTGPYLLYVYARCNSILESGKDKISPESSAELNAYTKELLRAISRYDTILLSSALTYSPSTLCSYLFDLGQTFNTFYTNVRVLDSENKEFLLGVVDATAQTMKHGLDVLGIKVVERM